MLHQHWDTPRLREAVRESRLIGNDVRRAVLRGAPLGAALAAALAAAEARAASARR
jgi:hypothetical protein